jgi:polysaccharide chain length determinant protein (PEP-CTERM system associated)
MLGHRALTVEDYLEMLKRRWRLLLLPVLILPLLAFGISFLVPPQYVSQTLVLVEQQKVPDDYVKPIVTGDVSERLASMKEQILSRSLLQPIIERFALFGNGGMQMDERIDRTRKAISIKPIHSDVSHSEGLPGFFISFTAQTPRLAQQVCGEISALFVRENVHAREQSAEGTTTFLKQQLADAKRSLDEQDRKLAIFQRKYVGKLPGQENGNINMLTSLNTQLEATTQALSRMHQDKSYEEAMLAQGSQQLPSSPNQPSLPREDRQAQLQQMLAQEAELETRYTPDHPDVIALRNNIEELKRKLAQPMPHSATPPLASTVQSEPAQVQQLRAQLRSLEMGIAEKKDEQALIQQQIRLYQDRIQSSPSVQEEFKQVTRDYQTAQQFYDDLLNKKNHSEMASDLEHRQQGEQFRVVDAPNLPDEPSLPKRWVFAIGGLFAGMCLGTGLTAFLEYRDTALRTERDVFAFTNLPTLALISKINTGSHDDARQRSKPRGRRVVIKIAPTSEPLIGSVGEHV